VWAAFDGCALLARGLLMYCGPCSEMGGWFEAAGLGPWSPAVHGTVSDWAMDLVSIEFTKPEVGGRLGAKSPGGIHRRGAEAGAGRWHTPAAPLPRHHMALSQPLPRPPLDPPPSTAQGTGRTIASHEHLRTLARAFREHYAASRAAAAAAGCAAGAPAAGRALKACEQGGEDDGGVPDVQGHKLADGGPAGAAVAAPLVPRSGPPSSHGGACWDGIGAADVELGAIASPGCCAVPAGAGRSAQWLPALAGPGATWRGAWGSSEAGGRGRACGAARWLGFGGGAAAEDAPELKASWWTQFRWGAARGAAGGSGGGSGMHEAAQAP
jgi:hypothetical protein